MLWFFMCLIIILVIVAVIFIIKFYDIKKLYNAEKQKVVSFTEKETSFLKEAGKLEQLNFILEEKNSQIEKLLNTISQYQTKINSLEQEKLSINKDKVYRKRKRKFAANSKNSFK